MGITAAEAVIWHVARRKHGRTQMRKAALFAGVAAVIAVYGVWAASTSARVAPRWV